MAAAMLPTGRPRYGQSVSTRYAAIFDDFMAQLIARNLDQELVARLKLRAAEPGRSAEAEHREILRQTLAEESRRSFKELAAKVRSMTAGRTHTPLRCWCARGVMNSDPAT
jgi:antitoxin FitA